MTPVRRGYSASTSADEPFGAGRYYGWGNASPSIRSHESNTRSGSVRRPGRSFSNIVTRLVARRLRQEGGSGGDRSGDARPAGRLGRCRHQAITARAHGASSWSWPHALMPVPSSGSDDRSAPRAYIPSGEEPGGWSDSAAMRSRRLAVVAVPPGGSIIPMIIQTIRLDPSGPDATDGSSHLSRLDPSGADQIDAEHQATDLASRVRIPRGQHTPARATP